LIDAAGVIAPGRLADLAVFELAHPRYFGLHDRLLGPVATGSARLRHLIVGGRVVVDHGAIPGIDLARLRHGGEARRGASGRLSGRRWRSPRPGARDYRGSA
jgi:8-oxoguanine deaminase